MRTATRNRSWHAVAAVLIGGGLSAGAGAAGASPAGAATRPVVGYSPVAEAVGASHVRPGALVHAAIVALARAKVFRTVTTSPSLKEVAVVEPRAGREAATSHLDGPAGRGMLRVVVSGGKEYLKGNKRGWADLLHLLRAPKTAVAHAEGLAGRWFVEPPARATMVDRFGAGLHGIGHVFCTGASCSLAHAKLLSVHDKRVVLAVPAFGGRLVLDARHRLRPLALNGTGARAGVRMRFAYPTSAPPVTAPAKAAPAPAVITH